MLVDRSVEKEPDCVLNPSLAAGQYTGLNKSQKLAAGNEGLIKVAVAFCFLSGFVRIH
jgi:hypothetical protein